MLILSARTQTVPPVHYFDALNYPDHQDWIFGRVGEMVVARSLKNKEVLHILELFNCKYNAMLDRTKCKVIIVVRGDLKSKFRGLRTFIAP